MKNKIKIAFDLDGCLIDIITPINKLLLEIHGLERKQHNEFFDMRASTGLSSKELWKVFRLAYKEIQDTPIFPGATELLAKLYEKTGEPPMILTSRPHDAANETYAIVKRLTKKTPFTLILKHPRIDKGRHLNGYKFFVEDRRRTALELSKMGFSVLLIRTTYNHIPNIDDIWNVCYIEGVQALIPYVDFFIS